MSILERYAAWVGLVLISITSMVWHSSPATAMEPIDPYEQVKRLGRGVNILGYDPIWDDFSKARFKEQDFKLIHDAGFQSVRINLHALQRLSAENGYKLGEAWLHTLDWAVENALANDLIVILNLHNYEDIAQDAAGYKPRLMAYWKQIARHFQDAPNSVLFEILNEPNGQLTPQLWNEFLLEALAIIRETNPARTVVIPPPFWDNINHLNDLELPEGDQNIIVTVHYYRPMKFTHQGASWEKETAHLSGISWGTAEEKKRVVDDFNRAQQWSVAHHRSLFLGEFGSYDKAPMKSRVRYTSWVARTAESLGWAWTYWQFDSDFIVYDIDKARWVEPIRKALVP